MPPVKKKAERRRKPYDLKVPGYDFLGAKQIKIKISRSSKQVRSSRENT